MPDILGREQVGNLAGVFSADKVRLTFGGANLAGHVVQSLGVNYQCPVNPIFELGSADRYYMVGRSSGQANIGQVLGVSLLTLELLQRLGDPCAAGDRSLTFEIQNCRPRQAGISALAGRASAAGTGTGTGAVPVKMSGCVSNTFSLNTEAQQVMIQIALSFIFASMSRN